MYKKMSQKSLMPVKSLVRGVALRTLQTLDFKDVG